MLCSQLGSALTVEVMCSDAIHLSTDPSDRKFNYMWRLNWEVLNLRLGLYDANQMDLVFDHEGRLLFRGQGFDKESKKNNKLEFYVCDVKWWGRERLKKGKGHRKF